MRYHAYEEDTQAPDRGQGEDEGWSINELRSDCKDYGISDYRRDWMHMSREQLAVWLYKHKGSAHRTYYEGRRCTK